MYLHTQSTVKRNIFVFNWVLFWDVGLCLKKNKASHSVKPKVTNCSWKRKKIMHVACCISLRQALSHSSGHDPSLEWDVKWELHSTAVLNVSQHLPWRKGAGKSCHPGQIPAGIITLWLCLNFHCVLHCMCYSILKNWWQIVFRAEWSTYSISMARWLILSTLFSSLRSTNTKITINI